MPLKETNVKNKEKNY